MGKEHLLLLSDLLDKYYLEIPFAQGMSDEIKKLLSYKKINFELILDFTILYPVINLIPYFKSMEKQDVECLISCVRSIFQETVFERVKELENMESPRLAILSADLLNDPLLKRQATQSIPEDLDRDRANILAEIFESSYSLLATGNSKPSRLFSRISRMRIPIVKTMDKMLIQFATYNTYFEDVSIKTSMGHSYKRFDYISVGTDQCVQYDPSSSIYYQLQPPVSTIETETPWNYSKKEVEGFEPKLLSVRITNCHSVFIHDIDTNCFWLLHISPGSMMGLNPVAGYPVKNAYIDLQQRYSDKSLGINQNARLEVVVVDKRGHFDEELFRKRIPGTINSIKIIKPTIELPMVIPSNLEKQYIYQVCFNPRQNLLAIKQNENYFEYPHVFNSLSLENSIVDNSKNDISLATLAQKFGINSDREQDGFLKETTVKDSVKNKI